MKTKRGTGFSLIELLMVVSLLTVLSLAIYGVFQGGISVMQRVSVGSPEEDIQIFLEKFSRDLMNSFPYQGIVFKGVAERVEFPATIKTVPELGGDRAIGRLTYAYDSSRRAISRRSENLSELYEEKEISPAAVLPNVHSVEFRYFAFDVVKKEFEWIEEWTDAGNKQTHLVAVELKFEIEGEEGEGQTVRQTVHLPGWAQPR